MFNEEKFNELNKRIDYKDEQDVVGISNKHFSILSKLVNQKDLKAQHIPFAFSYIYLQTYLFRFTKYDTYVPTVNEVKEILTFDKTTKTINYIIKDGGLLDAANLTKTTDDFPVVHEWIDGGLEFTLLSHFDEDYEYGKQWKKERKVNLNVSCKYPVLGFYDDTNSFNEVSFNNYGGTFFHTYNLTLIEWNVFNYCMSHDSLGCIGFYLYSFVKWQEGLNGNCQMGLETIAKKSCVPARTISKYMKVLREHNLVECISATFIVGADKKKKKDEQIEKESNTYFANEFKSITGDKVVISKPTFISIEHYRENKQIEEAKESRNNGSTLDVIDFDSLFG